MWLIWQECNNHTFEDIVRSTDLLKPILVGTLFQWVRIWGFAQCYSIFDFLLSVQISFWVICIHFKNRVFTIVNTMSYYAINYWLCIKKKKKFDDEEPPQGMRQWDHPWGVKTIDAYTPQLSRHRVNCEMPQLRVEPETSGFTVSPNTLPYHWGTLAGGIYLSRL